MRRLYEDGRYGRRWPSTFPLTSLPGIPCHVCIPAFDARSRPSEIAVEWEKKASVSELANDQFSRDPCEASPHVERSVTYLEIIFPGHISIWMGFIATIDRGGLFFQRRRRFIVIICGSSLPVFHLDKTGLGRCDGGWFGGRHQWLL